MGMLEYAPELCRYALEFEKRGFRVSRMSLQNEPHAVQTWDSCLWSAAEERTFLLDYMKQHEAYLTNSQLTDS